MLEEKRRLSFNKEQGVIESISTPLEECEYEKSVVSTKEKNEGSLFYKLYKPISYLPSTYFLIQSQFFNFLTTTCGTNSNHGMKAKGEGIGKELSIGYEDTSISLSLNPFLLCHELSFKELKLFLELNPSYVLGRGVGIVTIFPVSGKSTVVAASSANLVHLSSNAPLSLRSAWTTCALQMAPRFSVNIFLGKKPTVKKGSPQASPRLELGCHKGEKKEEIEEDKESQ
ncbi:hypothetical protein M9H77_16827 [Catharanthus roseus]|uniref:Uncharacterized protein n=1 Tax=Catharanthus roseus TaxID=4058 RepID=A0ACC0B2W0_CATRO|nr:hypothetical protein M9H77_16827 [Catharanthus roseus]